MLTLTSLLLALAADLTSHAHPDAGLPEKVAAAVQVVHGMRGLEIVVLVLLVVAVAYSFRRYRQAVLVRHPGPVHVHDFQNATGNENIDLLEMATSFRIALGRVHLTPPAAVPGAAQQTEFLELLKTAGAPTNPLASIAAVLGVTRVTHALEVSTTLRSRTGPSPCGLTVSVITLPRGGADPTTVWAPNWSLAVERAAIAVGAAILPRTRLCRRPPWHDWEGHELPATLFADYLDAKTLAGEHRYDEALGRYFRALQLDPTNLFIRLEIGALQEQLQLFLDALECYDDVIALGSRRDERRRDVRYDRIHRLVRLLLPSRAARERAVAAPPIGAGWRGKRGQAGIRPTPWPHRSSNLHQALLLARYRYTMVLGFSEVFLAQWIRDRPGNTQTRRQQETRRLRTRLLPRLAHYTYDPVRTGDTHDYTDGYHILQAVTPTGDVLVDEVEALQPVLAVVLELVQGFTDKAKQDPDCTAAHEPEFEQRSSGAQALTMPGQPVTVRSLEQALKSVIAASSICDQKDWQDEHQTAQHLLPTVQRHKVMAPGQVLRAQCLLQQAALTEVRQLARDYRLLTGRRRGRLSISSRALKVGIVWAELRLNMVERLLRAELLEAKVIEGPAIVWPPPVDVTRRRIEASLGRRAYQGLTWQDNYIAACAYSIPLLQRNIWAGRALDMPLTSSRDGTFDHVTTRDYARAAVRALERAIDSPDSHLVAGRRNWFLAEDPDLVGFRARPEYNRFRLRNVPSMDPPVPVPKNVHALQLSAYVTALITALARISECTWQERSRLPGSEIKDPDMVGWLNTDRASWQTVVDIATEGRDWRIRLSTSRFIHELGGYESETSEIISYPSYPDPRIGDLRAVSAPEDERRVTVASSFALQERRTQLERMALIAKSTLAKFEWDIDDLEFLDGAKRSTLMVNRIEAWAVVQQALSTDFFTDDKDKIKARRKRARILESSLEALGNWNPANDRVTAPDA